MGSSFLHGASLVIFAWVSTVSVLAYSPDFYHSDSLCAVIADGGGKYEPTVEAQVSAIPEAAEPTGATKDVQDLINPFKAKVGKGLAEWEAKQYIRKSEKIFVKVSVGGDSFVHLCIRLGATGQNRLLGKLMDKKADDPLMEFSV